MVFSEFLTNMAEIRGMAGRSVAIVVTAVAADSIGDQDGVMNGSSVLTFVNSEFWQSFTIVHVAPEPRFQGTS